MDIKQSMSIM